MARWGGDGYSPDSCIYVNTWDDFVDACNEALPDGSTSYRYRYITFPTVDQQGNPIPIERRIVDLRSRDWYRSDTIINAPCWLHIEGNDWVVLGLSLRDTIMIQLSINTNTTNRNWNAGNLIIRKLHFKNVYLQGTSSLIRLTTGGSRVREVSGCKFSGVLDTSTISEPLGSSDFGIVISPTTNNGYNVFTACSFNFKFVTWCRLSLDSSSTLGTNSGTEFNNCLFNFDGKATVWHGSGDSSASSGSAKRIMFYAKFYFCKITGDIIFDDTNSSATSSYYHFFYDKGTLNVIDIKVSYYPFDEIQEYNVYLGVGSGGSSQTQVMFIEYPPAAAKNMSLHYIANSTTFHIPSSREQLTDETWLTQNGFVVGTAPTE